MKNLVSFISLTIVLVIGLHGQSFEAEINSLYQDYKYERVFEYAFLETNEKIYYSGGTIDFSVIIFDQYMLPTLLSKIVHLELIQEESKFHERYVFRLDSGMLNGHINIPRNIPTGNYQLVAYTNFMHNYGLEHYSHRQGIYIQNVTHGSRQISKPMSIAQSEIDDGMTDWLTLQDMGSDYRISVDKNLVDRKSNTYLIAEGLRSLQFIARIGRKTTFDISKNLMKSSFQRFVLLTEDRELLASKNLVFPESIREIEGNKQANANNDCNTFDVAEVDVDQMTILRDRISNIFFKNTWDNALLGTAAKKITSFPEEHLQLRGNIVRNREVEKDIFLVLYFAKSKMESSHIIEGDQFAINLLLPVGKEKLLWSVMDAEGVDLSGDVDIIFEEEFKAEYTSTFDFHSLDYSDSILSLYSELNYAISTFSESEIADNSFADQNYMDEVYRIKDYQQLSSFEEFAREAMPKVSIKTTRSVKELLLYNPNQNVIFEDEPIILLNDQVIEDDSILFTIPLSAFSTISLAYTEASLNKLGVTFRNGIISARTEDLELPPVKIHPRFSELSTYANIIRKNEITSSFNSQISIKSTGEELQLKIISEDKNWIQFEESLSPEGKLELSYKNADCE